MDKNGYELLEEILADPFFPKWARGKAPEYDRYWDKWAGGSARKQEMLAIAKGLVKAVGSEPLRMSDAYIRQRVQAAMARSIPRSEPPPEHFLFRYGLRIAAGLLLFCLLGITLYRQWPQAIYQLGSNEEKVYHPLVTVRNTGETPRFIQLGDGSNVVLQQDGALQYPASFAAGKREVFLSGEAFFEVAHDTTAPFYVHANGAVTKVLGTSFKIKAQPHTQTLHVAVKTGKVAVFTEAEHRDGTLKNHPSPTFLTRNQEAVFDVVEQKLRRRQDPGTGLAAMPIEKLSFRYDSTPIKNVLQDLQTAYGVKILFDEKQLSHCSITAHLGEEALIQKIEWICTILEASYKQEGNQITIDARPCL